MSMEKNPIPGKILFFEGGQFIWQAISTRRVFDSFGSINLNGRPGEPEGDVLAEISPEIPAHGVQLLADG